MEKKIRIENILFIELFYFVLEKISILIPGLIGNLVPIIVIGPMEFLTSKVYRL